MTKEKWTPGPWRAAPWGDGTTPDGELNVLSDAAQTAIAIGVDKNDAYLIASAPELYEALIEMLAKFSRDMTTDDYDRIARTLTKARGEQ